MKNWYWKIFSILLTMYLSISLFYILGIDTSTSNKKSKFSLNREYDFSLYKINELMAFSISKSKYISLVKYKKTIAPFCFLCGEFEPDGTVINGIQYKKGDWFYTDFTNPFNEALNISTLELLDIIDEGFSGKDLTENEVFKEKNLIFSDSHKIDDTYIKNNFAPISTLNESCIIFNSAFIFLFGVWVIIGLLIFIKKSTSNN